MPNCRSMYSIQALVLMLGRLNPYMQVSRLKYADFLFRYRFPLEGVTKTIAIWNLCGYAYDTEGQSTMVNFAGHIIPNCRGITSLG